MSAPSGRALFVRRWATLPGGADMSAAEWADVYASRFQWAAVTCAWGAEVSINRDVERWRALSAAGVEVWAMWGLPPPMGTDTELLARVDSVLRWCDRVGAVGLMLDPEKKDGRGRDLRWDAHRPRAERLVRKVARSTRYALTSYGLPRGVRGFDMRPWLEGASLVIPQVYDGAMRFDPTYGPRALAQYRALGMEPGAAHAWGVGTWNKRDREPKTEAELRAHLAATPRGPIIAWPWGTLDAPTLDVLASAPTGTTIHVPRGGGSRRGGGGGGGGGGGLWALAAAVAAFFFAERD